MNREDIIREADEWLRINGKTCRPPNYDMMVLFSQHIAALVAAAKDAEHKEAMRWDIHSCGPTCKRYACVATREAVDAEREACAKVCDDLSAHYWAKDDAIESVNCEECATAIRARKETT